MQLISSDMNFPYEKMKAILINLSCYKSDHLACLALNLLTQMHFLENTLFSQSTEVQLLVTKESIAEYRKISELLPRLRHLLSIDAGIQGQWKIVDILDTLTGMCSLPDGEPHRENQQLLFNFGQFCSNEH